MMKREEMCSYLHVFCQTVNDKSRRIENFLGFKKPNLFIHRIKIHLQKKAKINIAKGIAGGWF